MQVLDVGCGPSKTPGSVGLDIAPLPGVDIVHDLNSFPYPIEDNTFDKVLCYSVLEHVVDVMRTLEELHRIMKPGGELVITLPHYSHPMTYRDPTHIHFFSFGVVNYLAGSSYAWYGKGRFKIKEAKLGEMGRDSFLRRLINKNPYFFEKVLAPIRPVQAMYFILIAEKEILD